MSNFDNQTIEKVWEKAKIVSQGVRKDTCGATIKRNEYGNRNSKYGWEIDHIDPNGGDYLSNLQPLQWENNVAKSDGNLKCVVTA